MRLNASTQSSQRMRLTACEDGSNSAGQSVLASSAGGAQKKNMVGGGVKVCCVSRTGARWATGCGSLVVAVDEQQVLLVLAVVVVVVLTLGRGVCLEDKLYRRWGDL